jgi:hypothetical protein
MNKYHNGKIYTIRSYNNDKYYIGSTTQELYKRLYEHKSHYKTYLNKKCNYISSFEISKNDDCYIELLENFKCETKNELTKREGELIRQFKNDIVNLQIPDRKREEYYEDNKDKIKAYEKEYNKINRNERTLKHLEYVNINKDKINAQRRDNYQKKKNAKN